MQRDLWPEYKRWLRPGGVLFIETMTRKMLEIQPDLDPLFLLETGELATAFSGWDILVIPRGLADVPAGSSAGGRQHGRPNISLNDMLL